MAGTQTKTPTTILSEGTQREFYRVPHLTLGRTHAFEHKKSTVSRCRSAYLLEDYLLVLAHIVEACTYTLLVWNADFKHSPIPDVFCTSLLISSCLANVCKEVTHGIVSENNKLWHHPLLALNTTCKSTGFCLQQEWEELTQATSSHMQRYLLASSLAE